MTYEYQCRITEAPQTRCPSCEKETAMRLISKSTFILNGQNWERKDGY